jgi:hypothetical protein
MFEKQISLKQKIVLAAIFALFLLIGFGANDDYGIAWDEPAQQEIGRFNFEYLSGSSDTLATYHDRFYGAAFELPLYALQKLSGIEDSANVFEMRHLLTHLFFLLALGFFFALVWKLFRKFHVALLAMLMLYIHPRIFAHSFFNSKDIVFMSFFIIALYTLYLLVEKQNTKRLLWHALASALLIDTRIVGAIMPLLTLGVFFPMLLRRNSHAAELWKALMLYAAATIFLMFAFWPALWTDPLLIGKSFARMSHFPFRYDVLFTGRLIPAPDLPFYYLPVWIFISTPPFILLLFIIGLGWSIRDYFRNPDAFFENPKQWYLLSVIGFPIDFIMLIILLGSTVYDGWRQLYFVYPAMLIAAAYAYNKISEKLRYKSAGKYAVNGLIIVFMLLTALKIYKLHPYEQVYFNHFAAKKNENRRKSFEQDYWGLSFREGLEYVLKHEPDDRVKICFSNAAGPVNILALPPAEQARIMITDKPEEADYFITNYRYHPQDYPYQDEVFSIWRDKNKILSVFRIGEKQQKN